MSIIRTPTETNEPTVSPTTHTHAKIHIATMMICPKLFPSMLVVVAYVVTSINAQSLTNTIGYRWSTIPGRHCSEEQVQRLKMMTRHAISAAGVAAELSDYGEGWREVQNNIVTEDEIQWAAAVTKEDNPVETVVEEHHGIVDHRRRLCQYEWECQMWPVAPQNWCDMCQCCGGSRRRNLLRKGAINDGSSSNNNEANEDLYEQPMALIQQDVVDHFIETGLEGCIDPNSFDMYWQEEED